MLGAAEVAAANRALDGATPDEIVGWALDTFGTRLVLTASFADTTLIDIATRVDPDIEVVFLDTGFHFAETLNVVRRAMERYSLNLTVLRPQPDAADVWASGTKACCDARKVEPLERYLVGHADAWLSGLRRADDAGRAEAPIVSVDKRGLIKVNPMADDERRRVPALRRRARRAGQHAAVRRLRLDRLLAVHRAVHRRTRRPLGRHRHHRVRTAPVSAAFEAPYPVNLDLWGRRVLVVGGGQVAARKVAGLLSAGAAVTVVAPDAVAEIAEDPDVRWHQRPYRRGEVASYRLAITATDDPSVNRQVARDGDAANVLVNSADDPANCSFILPAVVRRGDLQLTVSTNGLQPGVRQLGAAAARADLHRHPCPPAGSC